MVGERVAGGRGRSGGARRGARRLLPCVVLTSVLALVTGCASSRAGAPAAVAATMALTSPVMAEGGDLPAEYTCDGAALTPPIAWTGVPAGARSLALVMHHVAGPGDTHWYWVLYDIAPTVTHLDAGAAAPASVGTNSVDGRTGYTPPCSKGPGPKTYTFTLYALSAAPALPSPANVSRQVLLDAIAQTTLATATLDVTYTRPATAAAAPPPPGS